MRISPMFFLLAVSCVFALESNATRLDKLESEVGSMRTRITPSASPKVDGDGWTIGLDILYWMPRVEGTAYAYTNDRNSTTLPINGTTIDLDFHWAWGFRPNVGYFAKYGDWDIEAAVTIFTPRGRSAKTKDPSNMLIPLKGIIQTSGGVNQVQSNYRLNLYDLTAELGRNFYVNETLALRPSIGLESTWLKQQQTTRYSGGSNLGGDMVLIRDTCHFWGMGPRFTFGSEWFLGRGFNIFADIAGALLYGYFDVQYYEARSSSTSQQVTLDNPKHRFAPNLQGCIGFGWRGYVNHDKNYVNVGLAYEGQYWWNQVQFFQFYEYGDYRYTNLDDDLGIQGLTVRLSFAF